MSAPREPAPCPMHGSLIEQKAALRERVRATVRELTRAQRDEAAVELCARLIEQPVWKNACSVLLFSPLPDEPNVRPLLYAALGSNKVTALPRFSPATRDYEAALIQDPETDLREGKFGILEPGPLCKVGDLNRLDLVLVPGVAFDWHGRRLGRGRGYYDRLLAAVSGKTCGVAFDQQRVAAIPVEPHDVPLNCILTPSHWLEL